MQLPMMESSTKMPREPEAMKTTLKVQHYPLMQEMATLTHCALHQRKTS